MSGVHELTDIQLTELMGNQLPPENKKAARAYFEILREQIEEVYGIDYLNSFELLAARSTLQERAWELD
jgi:hypothetical protein